MIKEFGVHRGQVPFGAVAGGEFVRRLQEIIGSINNNPNHDPHTGQFAPGSSGDVASGAIRPSWSLSEPELGNGNNERRYVMSPQGKRIAVISYERSGTTVTIHWIGSEYNSPSDSVLGRIGTAGIHAIAKQFASEGIRRIEGERISGARALNPTGSIAKTGIAPWIQVDIGHLAA